MALTNTTKTKKEVKSKKFLRDFYAIRLLKDKDLRDYLLKLVSAILKDEIGELGKDYELIDIKLGNSINYKKKEADILLENEENIINVEVNYNIGKYTDYKNMTYCCELILRQLRPGNKYRSVKPVYQVNINNQDNFKQKRFIYRSVLMETDLKIRRNNNLLTIVDINLDFLTELTYTEVKEMEEDSLERLLYFFVNDNHEELDIVYMGDKIMEKVKSKLYDLDWENLDQYLLYDREELRKADLFDLGKDEGLEEGKLEARLEAAKALIDNGIDLDFVIKTLKLTDEEIKKLGISN